ncbi:MAG: hypothetical protein MZV63_12280 [Marinilabiliales bacterium]|nr:hypothetical protein [Marinilabiliales bacterium]
MEEYMEHVTVWEGIKFKKHRKGDVIYIRFSQKLFCPTLGFYSIDFDIATAKFPADDIEVLHNSSSVLLFQVESQKPYAGIIDLNSEIQLKE